MRARLIFIVIAIVLVGGFAAQNWGEFNRASPLTFGVVQSEAPLGLILLGILGITLLVFLFSSAMQESRNLSEWNRHSKALQAQRDLAEKAEASRFTDLRNHLDTHLRENRQREAISATEFEKSMMQSQRDLRAQIEQMNHALSVRLGELESRIDSRLDNTRTVSDVAQRPLDTPPRDRVKL